MARVPRCFMFMPSGPVELLFGLSVMAVCICELLR